jgi:hypothetical protein
MVNGSGPGGAHAPRRTGLGRGDHIRRLGLVGVSTDGGVYTLGGAPFFGSVPGLGLTPAAPIVGMTRTPDGSGYWLVCAPTAGCSPSVTPTSMEAPPEEREFPVGRAIELRIGKRPAQRVHGSFMEGS